MEEECEGLKRLAEAHVVREDPAELVAVQERQPVEAVLLVVAQLGSESGGRLDRFRRAQRGHLLDAACPSLRLGPDHGESGELLPPARLEAVDPDGARAFGVGEAPRLTDELAQLIQLGSVEVQPRAAREHQHRLVERECPEELGEADRFAVDADLDRQIEPVVVLVVAFGITDVELDERIADRSTKRGRVTADLDGHLTTVDQPRHDLGEQGHRL